MLGQLLGLQVVKKKGDFPLLAGVWYNFLAVLPRPIPLVSTGNNDEIVWDEVDSGAVG